MTKYDAFISYSRAADGEFAPKVRAGLQALARPWNKRRALSIFLDQAALELGSGLGKTLRAKLDDSEWLVLMLSEDSANSEWVGAEIASWVAANPNDRIALVHTDGVLQWGDGDWDWEHSTAAPRALSAVYDEEPLWLDLRAYGGAGDLDIRTNQAFKNDLATLAAPLHGKSKEELVGEDLVQFRKARRLRRGAVVALAALTIIAGLAAVLAVRNAQEADRQRADAIVARNAEKEQRLIAEEEARVANSRRLAAQAREELSSRAEVEDNFPDEDEPAELARRRSRALLLALTAVSIEPTGDALGSLAEGLLVGGGPEPIGVRLSAPGGDDRTVAFGPEGDIAAAGEQGEIQYWAEPGADAIPLDGTVQSDRDQHGHPVAFHPDGGLLASGGGGTILLWDLTRLDAGPLVPESLPAYHSTASDFLAPVQGLAFSADGRLLVSAGHEGDVVVWNLAARSPLRGPFETGSMLRDVATNSDGTLVAASSSQGEVFVWSLAPGGDILDKAELPYLDFGVVSGVAVHDDGVVSASSWDHDQTIAVWASPFDRPSDRLTLTLRGEGFTAQAIDFSDDGTRLASAGRTVLVWDLEERQPIIELVGHVDGVNDVEFGRNDTSLVSSNLTGGGVIVWDLSLDTWIGLACREAGRNMTQREWVRFVGGDVSYERTCAAFGSGEGVPATAPAADYTSALLGG